MHSIECNEKLRRKTVCTTNQLNCKILVAKVMKNWAKNPKIFHSSG